MDEVAAQHAAVDLMIHFGDACLSPYVACLIAPSGLMVCPRCSTRRFPVRYVFGHGNLDVAAVAASLSSAPRARCVVVFLTSAWWQIRLRL